MPRGPGCFPQNSTTEENLDLGAHARKDKVGIQKDLESVYALFPRLKERRKQSAGTLSGGEQQNAGHGPGLDVQTQAFYF